VVLKRNNKKKVGSHPVFTYKRPKVSPRCRADVVRRLGHSHAPSQPPVLQAVKKQAVAPFFHTPLRGMENNIPKKYNQLPPARTNSRPKVDKKWDLSQRALPAH